VTARPGPARGARPARASDRAIGLLGGTFDPIHAGHLQLARDALAALPLAQLRLMPAGQPWQKTGVTAGVDRARMVELALAVEPAAVRARLVLDARELDRPGPTYTVDTLEQVRAELGAHRPIVLVMGGDQFERLATWHAWQRIPLLAHLAVARRDAAPLQLAGAVAALHARARGVPRDLLGTPAGRVVEFAMTPSEATATGIRHALAARALRQGADAPAPGANTAAATPGTSRLAEWVPAPVLDYIRDHHLYL
jgi:nicotinate-nucleotide adenylyltransferase